MKKKIQLEYTGSDSTQRKEQSERRYLSEDELAERGVTNGVYDGA